MKGKIFVIIVVIIGLLTGCTSIYDFPSGSISGKLIHAEQNNHDSVMLLLDKTPITFHCYGKTSASEFILFCENNIGEILLVNYTYKETADCYYLIACSILPRTWYSEYHIKDNSEKKTIDPCPSGTKLVRSTNGTLYSTYYIGEGTSAVIARSIDDGQTWTVYQTIDFTIDQYDMCLAIDSADKLHLFWASGCGNGMGMRYKNWTSAGVGSAVLNITTYNTDGPECQHMVINASDAIYFFWYNNNNGADKYNMQNRTLYNGVLSPIHNITERKTNCSDGFMFGCCDNNDVIHLVWVQGEGTHEGVNYLNITNNVQSDTRHLFYSVDTDNDDQASASIVTDSRNNLSVTWTGRPFDAAYETRHMYYWFANQTWSGIRNLGDVSTDDFTYPYPFQTVDWNNTVYISVSGSNAGDKGQRYYKYETDGTYSSAVRLTTSNKTSNNFCLYQNYPQFSVGGSTVYTMRPKSGFSVYYWNASGVISYMNVSAYYSGIT